MNKFKRAISILLCVLMLVGYFPAGVLAYEEECTHPYDKITDGVCECGTEFAADIKVGGTVTLYKEAELDEAFGYASANSGAKLTLYTDLDYTTKTEGAKSLEINTYDKDNSRYNELTIDLNGHEIKGEDYGINISGGDITVEDSSEGGTGKITATARHSRKESARIMIHSAPSSTASQASGRGKRWSFLMKNRLNSQARPSLFTEMLILERSRSATM